MLLEIAMNFVYKFLMFKLIFFFLWKVELCVDLFSHLILVQGGSSS